MFEILVNGNMNRNGDYKITLISVSVIVGRVQKTIPGRDSYNYDSYKVKIRNTFKVSNAKLYWQY